MSQSIITPANIAPITSSVGEMCVDPGRYAPLSLNISIHVTILFTILSLFFMFYISKLSADTLNHEIIHNLNNAIDAGVNKIPVQGRNMLSTMSKSVNIDKLKSVFSKPDALVEMHNKWLFRSIILVNICLFIIVCLISFLLMKQCNQCIPLKHILIENGLTFTLVGIVEVLFFKFVALKYVPTKPSTIISAFLNSVTKNI
jgi:hypothetical protein